MREADTAAVDAQQHLLVVDQIVSHDERRAQSDIVQEGLLLSP